MTLHSRNLSRVFAPVCQSRYPNILVTGCSFTFNNSEQHICTWPYYLRDLCALDCVYDVSQMGTGANHAFNSIVSEIECNKTIDPQDTLVMVMWSGLSRVDVVAESEITHPYHWRGNHDYDHQFSTLSLYRDPEGDHAIDRLARDYSRVVSIESQIYESLLRIVALDSYLQQQGFQHVFLSWMDPAADLALIHSPLTKRVRDLLVPVQSLECYARQHDLKLTDGHPSPDAHLGWTKSVLIPWLHQQALTTDLDSV